MDSEKIKRFKSVAKHLLIVVGLAAGIILTFFYLYLPMTTNHGETITVPDISNQHYSDLDNILVDRSLRYEVNVDSGYSAKQEPLTVLDQFPKPNARVKENRKIYITLNARRPPLVKMPDLVLSSSLKIAQITLETMNLEIGEVSYVPHGGLNLIIGQSHNGKPINAGELIPKGSVIDLEVGDGHGNREWEMYDYINRPYEEVMIAISGTGLKSGNVTYVSSPSAVIRTVNETMDTVDAVIEVELGSVVKQAPAVGEIVRLQDLVDLWVYLPDSATTEQPLIEIPE